MALTLTPKQEVVLEQSVRTGRYSSASDALNAALTSFDAETFLNDEEKSRLAAIRSKSLLEVMQQSPFRNLDVEFERDRSPMREFDL